MQRMLLSFGAFFSALILAFFGPAIIEKLTRGVVADPPGFSKIEYHPGDINRLIEMHSPDGSLIASAGEAGIQRAVMADGASDAIDKLVVHRGATTMFELLHHADGYTNWRELGSVEWLETNTVVFTHEHPDESGAHLSVTVDVGSR